MTDRIEISPTLHRAEGGCMCCEEYTDVFHVVLSNLGLRLCRKHLHQLENEIHKHLARDPVPGTNVRCTTCGTEDRIARLRDNVGQPFVRCVRCLQFACEGCVDSDCVCGFCLEAA